MLNKLNQLLIEIAQGRRNPEYSKNWSWTTHPLIQKSMNEKIFSVDKYENVYDYISKKYGNKINKLIDLGCGSGSTLSNMYKYQIGDHYTGVDISSVGINNARKMIPENKSNFFTCDLNNENLNGKYDFVYLWFSMHHIENLERLVDNILNILTDDGLLLIYDFFGPSELQYSQQHRHLLNSCLEYLPSELKIYKCSQIDKLLYLLISNQLTFYKGSFIRKKQKNLPKWLLKLRDPSEAIRSGEMHSILLENFKIVEDVGLPGALIEPIFDFIINNFKTETSENYLKNILDFEQNCYKLKFINPNRRWMLLKK